IADFFPIGASRWWLAAITFALLAIALFCWPNLGATYLLVGAGFFLLHNFRIGNTAGLQLAADLTERPRAANAVGFVTSEPKVAPNGFATFLLRLESIEFERKTRPTEATLLVRWRGNPEFGDKLKLFGIAEPITPPRNPGEFDMRSYLARQDVRRSLFVRYPEDGVLLKRGAGNPILRAAQKSRAWMQSAICRGLDDSPQVQNFLSGIVLGLRHQSPEDIKEPFQQTGTVHLFAVAGLHVGIVARLLWILAMVARLSRKWATIVIIPLLLFYAAITGLHVSSIRAAVMSSILLGGFFFERKVFALNSLAAAAFFLLSWNTNEFFSTGFQLSFALVGGIILLADPLSGWLRPFGAPDPFLPRRLVSGLRRMIGVGYEWVFRGGSVSLAAWLGSLPLIFWYFHLLSVKTAKVLFISDSGDATERSLIGSGVDLRSDVLVKGQHHSGNSGSDNFLDAGQPRLIGATSLDFPPRERISDEWAQRVQARGIKLFRQDETGAVELEFGESEWQARAYL